MTADDQVKGFAAALRRLGVLFIRVAGRQSESHQTLSKQELMAIGVLGQEGPCRMGEIAEHLGVVQSAVTALVDRLEGQGLASRVRSEADRRVWLVELTPKGQSAFAEEEAVYEGVAREMLRPLSPAEQRTLTDLLARIEDGASLDPGEATPGSRS